MSRLAGKRFQRAGLAIREPGNDVPGAVGDAAPVREDDARNLRQLGVGTAAAGLGLGEAMAPDGQAEPQRPAAAGGVILLVHAASREAAGRILRESGAARVWRAGPPGGAWRTGRRAGDAPAGYMGLRLAAAALPRSITTS